MTRPAHLGLVLDTPGVIVIRSALPLEEDLKTFAYEGIIDQTTTLVGKKIENPYLIDVCLLDNTGERGIFAPEVASFVGVSPDKWPTSYWPPYEQSTWTPTTKYGKEVQSGTLTKPGSFMWWPIQGVGKGDDPTVYLTSPGWDFSGCVDNLCTIVDKPLAGKTTILLFHCSSGADRTGALNTGFLMKYKGMTLEAASKQADSLMGPPNVDYCRLRTAYNKYLNGN